MKLSTMLTYDGNPRSAADRVAELEQAGLDTVWVAEVYGFDSPTLMGYLAARTETIEIGAAILNVYSRTPTLLAQTAAGLDNVSGGRAVLGLGASGPQVIEGWHGVPYSKPLGRTREAIEIIRAALRREVVEYSGKSFQLPLPRDEGTGLGKPLKMLTRPERSSVPIYLAALGQKSVEGAAEYADGWLPFLFSPEGASRVWGDALAAGTAKRHADLGPLEIAAGGMVGDRGRRQGDARPRAADDRSLHRWDGGTRQELLQRPRVQLRLRGRGQGDPGPLPGRQEEGGRGGGARSSCSSRSTSSVPQVSSRSGSLPSRRPASPTCRSLPPVTIRPGSCASSRNGSAETSHPDAVAGWRLA